MKNKLIGLCVVFIVTFAQSVFAGGPEKGELTVRGRGAISSIDIKYNISQLMGESNTLMENNAKTLPLI
jgi:hypothetical protein